MGTVESTTVRVTYAGHVLPIALSDGTRKVREDGRSEVSVRGLRIMIKNAFPIGREEPLLLSNGKLLLDGDSLQLGAKEVMLLTPSMGGDVLMLSLMANGPQ